MEMRAAFDVVQEILCIARILCHENSSIERVPLSQEAVFLFEKRLHYAT